MLIAAKTIIIFAKLHRFKINTIPTHKDIRDIINTCIALNIILLELEWVNF